jgi:two-component system sensor histidine kinase DesK
MSIAAADQVVGFPDWVVRRASLFLVVMHVPFAAAGPLFAITRHADIGFGGACAFAAAGAAIGALQLRHSLAAARGERARHWPWTFAMLLVLAYLPGRWAGIDWILVSQWFVVASAAMVLRGRVLVSVAVALPAIGQAMAQGVILSNAGSSNPQAIIWATYDVAIIMMGGVALLGSARLVGVLDQLFAARTELAEREIGRERLRMSRDLHDLLGHSLSAVSLKGDLAIRLLPVDPPAARREIESLTGVARTALRDMRAVARDEHIVTLRAEIDAAAAVLQAAGVEVRVAVVLPDLPVAVDAALAWAVREGATNVLRHSEAETCSITAGLENELVRLEIRNDGAHARRGVGNGLAGVAERASAFRGHASNERSSGGEFRLVVEIPVGSA